MPIHYRRQRLVRCHIRERCVRSPFPLVACINRYGWRGELPIDLEASPPPRSRLAHHTHEALVTAGAFFMPKNTNAPTLITDKDIAA